MTRPCEASDHIGGKTACILPLPAAIGKTGVAGRTSAKTPAKPMFDRAAAPVEAIHASGKFTHPSERSARAVENIGALGEMTRGIAHDFRNVLTMLSSGLNIAEANSGNSAKLKLALAAMQEGVARGMKMTNRLLAFARQQELKPRVDDINALLTELKPFLRYGAGPGIRVALDLAPGIPKCLVHPPQLNAAIFNLIVNARDAMRDGGVVRISTRLARPGGALRDYVRVRVRDNGAGMTADVIAHIFDPFFTTKGDAGTGLGIPQVLASMQRLGGEVSVHSAVGKGATFDLFFPVHESPKAASDDRRQLDRWADEGGAIVAPPAPHHRP